MAQIGSSITISSVGPGGTPDIAFSNAFIVVQSPWGIDNSWVICASFQDFLRQFGGLNKLTTVAAGTTADTYYTEATATVVQGYYAVKGYFDEKQQGSPGVAYICRVVKSSGGSTAASLTKLDYSAANTTTWTSKWKGRDGATVQASVINPSPRKGLFVAQSGTTLTTSSGSPTVTNSGTGFTTGSTWVGYGIKIGSSYYTILSVGSTSSLTLTENATASAGSQTWSIGPGNQTAYFKLYHPQSGILEEWDISNSDDAVNASKRSQLATIALPSVPGSGFQLPQSFSAVKINSGSSATADAYDASDPDLVGTTTAAGVKTGLQVFNEQRLGTGFVAIPGKYSSTIRTGVKTHCETYYRHGLLGSGSGFTLSTVVTDVGTTSSSRMSYWYPQVYVSNQGSDTSALLLVDPVGHIAGLGARMDRDYRGPHKSPAGVTHPFVSVIDVERTSTANGMELIDDSGSNTLADSFINTLRIKNNGVVSWGLRTLSSDARFRQINASRTIDYIYLAGNQILEKFVMEPIDAKLFGRVKASLDAFLDELHNKGSLYGQKPGKNPTTDAAWFTVCDPSNNPGVQLGAGELHCDVTVICTPNAEKITCNLYAAAPGFIGKQQ